MAAIIEAPVAPGRRITGRTIALLASIGVAAAVAAGGIGFVLGQQGDQAPASAGVAVSQDLSGMYSPSNVQALKNAGFGGHLGVFATKGQVLSGMYSPGNVQALKDAGFTGQLGITTPQGRALSDTYSVANVQAARKAWFEAHMGGTAGR